MKKTTTSKEELTSFIKETKGFDTKFTSESKLFDNVYFLGTYIIRGDKKILLNSETGKVDTIFTSGKLPKEIEDDFIADTLENITIYSEILENLT